MKVSEQIIEVLNALCEKIGIAIDWSADNILPYAQQLCERFISYEIWTTVVSMSVYTLLFVGAIIFFINRNNKVNKLIQQEDNGYYDIYDTFEEPLGWLWLLSIVAMIIITIGFVIIIPVQIKHIVTCVTFPEKLIYELISQSISAN